MMRWFVVAASLTAGCIHKDVRIQPRTKGEPHSVEWAASADVNQGACDAIEYTLNSKSTEDYEFVVTAGDDGRARDVSLMSPGDAPPARAAIGVVRHLFRCRHKLAPDAIGKPQRYRLRLAPVDSMPEVDSGKCGLEVAYPSGLPRTQALVRVGVGVDEHGHVDVAWVDGASGSGFAEAAVDAIAHRCKFGPASSGGKTIPVFLMYTFAFTR